MDKRQLTRIIAGAVIALVIFGVLIAIVAATLSRDGGLFGPSGDRVALVKLQGVIYDSAPVVRNLRRYADDARVKAIVLRVDSPGGGVAASQEIYQELNRLRTEKNKKIVVSMGSVAASGGYYVACAADHVVANPGTVTGSIGVIAEWYNYGALLNWAGLKPEVIKSGALKDMGSPVRPMTDEERLVLQSMIDRLYNQFVGVVVTARSGHQGLDETRIRALADGRVFTGDEALQYGFVDELGDERTAILSAARMVNIQGEPIVVEPPPEKSYTILDLLTKTDVTELSSRGLPGGSPSGASMQFGYVWK
ncbi:MAG TPA: signal peptide peptidase SppA [Blastocatellia bacterium]|nr:signal peptide peptidase SppA [Blastocatellia bacterium]